MGHSTGCLRVRKPSIRTAHILLQPPPLSYWGGCRRRWAVQKKAMQKLNAFDRKQDRHATSTEMELISSRSPRNGSTANGPKHYPCASNRPPNATTPIALKPPPEIFNRFKDRISISRRHPTSHKTRVITAQKRLQRNKLYGFRSKSGKCSTRSCRSALFV